MIKLDDDLLQELGLAGLPAEEKKKLLAHIYETLEMRVGMKLAEQMSDAQLTEFEQFIDRNDEGGAPEGAPPCRFVFRLSARVHLRQSARDLVLPDLAQSEERVGALLVALLWMRLFPEIVRIDSIGQKG